MRVAPTEDEALADKIDRLVLESLPENDGWDEALGEAEQFAADIIQQEADD